jgi:NAD(P)-dependent dehydrogenase (short-subunit alcohol dehydrogenase family)
VSTGAQGIDVRFNLVARYAVVTGGAGGFALDIVEGLARAGAQVVLIDVATEALPGGRVSGAIISCSGGFLAS